MKTLKDIGLIVTATMTTPSKPGKQPRPVWNVTGSTSGYEALFRDLGGRKFRAVWSFWSDPTEDLLRHADNRMTPGEIQEYKAERKLAKAERYEQYAENAAERSNAAHARVQAICDRIPFGQPILVGHHSERSARADQKRIHNGMDKAVSEAKKADYFESHSASLRRDAERPKSLKYIGNRIKEKKSEIRKLETYLAGKYYVNDLSARFEVKEEDRIRWTGLVERAKEELIYWESELKAWTERTGRALPSPETIRVGMFVASWAGWLEVVRINKKSVTVKDRWPSGNEFTRTIEYTEIKGFKEKDGAA